MATQRPHFIIIDGSYFIFYRFFAITSWMKIAKKDENVDIPIENEFFVDKFRSTFISKLKEMQKKLKIKNGIMLACKDCPRESIWRMKHLPSYKANRVYDDTFMGGPFFKMAWNDELFIKGGCKKVFKYPTLEADDCAAILCKDIQNKYPDYCWVMYPNIIIADVRNSDIRNEGGKKYMFDFAKKTRWELTYYDINL